MPLLVAISVAQEDGLGHGDKLEQEVGAVGRERRVVALESAETVRALS